MKRSVSFVVLLVLCLDLAVFAGIGSDKAMFVGGTVSTVPEKTEGTLSLGNADNVLFQAKGASLQIPYSKIDSLEYGQKAGRRVGMAVMISPALLFSKKRKHYLTIGYKDGADKQQAVVLELGKGIVKTTLSTLEAKSGKKVEYQDDDARKSAGQ